MLPTAKVEVRQQRLKSDIAIPTARFVVPVARCDKPVVETSLLTGAKGSALVLVNYTYQPIDTVTVDLKLSQPVIRAVSTEGRDVKIEKTPDGVRLRVPLEWADIILLQ